VREEVVSVYLSWTVISIQANAKLTRTLIITFFDFAHKIQYESVHTPYMMREALVAGRGHMSFASCGLPPKTAMFESEKQATFHRYCVSPCWAILGAPCSKCHLHGTER
jgi:hypothetical protein